jgi:hypothetical protein
MPDWLDNLVASEAKQIVKKAQDDKLADIEKRIDEAKTPEELDKLEQELKELESNASKDEGSDEDQGGEKKGTEKADTADTGDKPAGKDDEEYDEDSEESDPESLVKDVKDIKKQLSTGQEKTQEKLLSEIEQLNDQMGLNKIVDLNNTVED